jgi:hypothetical protein
LADRDEGKNYTESTEFNTEDITQRGCPISLLRYYPEYKHGLQNIDNEILHRVQNDKKHQFFDFLDSLVSVNVGLVHVGSQLISGGRFARGC